MRLQGRGSGGQGWEEPSPPRCPPFSLCGFTVNGAKLKGRGTKGQSQFAGPSVGVE